MGGREASGLTEVHAGRGMAKTVPGECGNGDKRPFVNK